MNGWLIYYKLDAKKNIGYINLYLEKCKDYGLDIRLVYAEDLDIEIDENCNTDIGIRGTNNKRDLTIPRPCFVIVRLIEPSITKLFELMGVPTFNSSTVSEICNNKALTYQYLANRGITILDTWFNISTENETKYYQISKTNDSCININSNLHSNNIPYIINASKKRNNVFVPDKTELRSVDTIYKLTSITPLPLVVKTCEGHGGSEVFLVRTKDELIRILDDLEGRNIVIQELANNIGKDLRVYVIGKEIIAGMLRTNPTSFKSNYSLGGKAQFYELNSKEKALVQSIIEHFDFGLVGIDFIFHNGQMIFNEIEDVVGARMLYANTDIDLVGRYLEFIKKTLS